MRSLLLLPLLSLAASASFHGNLNYRSPSHVHADLGIAMHRVEKRDLQSPELAATELNFTHGIASGDPWPYSVILWTRISPMMENNESNKTVEGFVPLFSQQVGRYIRSSHHPICVEYKVATDEGLVSVVSSGTAYTTSDIDYTVKVEALNLYPFTNYYYQFNVCGSTVASPIGRTKTAPLPDDDVTSLSLAIYSCSNYPFGFFNAYGNPVRKQSVDYVIHLGDYIYEYKNGDYGNGKNIGRIPQPDREIYTLYDYRTRLATYRTDLDLLLSHQHYAWIPVWDDHEVSDNTWKAGSSTLFNTEGSFKSDGGVSVDQRKMNAVRAYFEWMPIRSVEMDNNLRIWRTFQLGNLVDLIMLDTRQYDRSITDIYTNTKYIDEISNDASRSLMGPRQENWFYHQLQDSAERGATWRLVGSQIVFSRLNESKFLYSSDLNLDSWDGYMANKNRTLHHLYSKGIGNNIFLAGDSHASWVSDLVWLNSTTEGDDSYDSLTGEGALGVEFGGTAVTSPIPFGDIGLDKANKDSDWLVGANRELQWQDAYYRGYYELHITHESVVANFFGMPNVRKRTPFEIPLANFTVMNGSNRLLRPVAGGSVESGSLNHVKGGGRLDKQMTNDTSVPGGRWFVSHI